MKKDIKIFDNFLKQESYKEINDIISGTGFPWYFNEETTFSNNPRRAGLLNNYQFTHIFYDGFQPKSAFFNILYPLLEKINPDYILRIKANLNPYTENHFEFGMHSDFNLVSDNIFTAIYYLNTNNGYTKFENDIKVDAISNRLVTFPCNFSHSGISTTDSKKRILINFNYAML